MKPKPRVLALLPALLLSAALGGCRDLPDDGAVRLVRAYNDRLVEAYRTADPMKVEPVAGPAEAKKLTGLIGAKADMGIFLDARLTEFRALGIERPSARRVIVRAEESWEYADRRIGGGEPVGQPSRDSYRMLYVLEKFGGAWKVESVSFEAPPVVGRTAPPVSAPAAAFHGAMVEPDPAAPREPNDGNRPVRPDPGTKEK